MTELVHAKDIKQEAKFLLKGNRIDLPLVEIFVEDRDGTAEERRRLAEARSRLGAAFFIEVLYVLTHLISRDSAKAEKIVREVLDHRRELDFRLGRRVSVQVAALDYLQSIRHKMARPVIIEEQKLRALAEKAVSDELTRAFDADLLRRDLQVETERAERYGTPLSLAFADIDDFKRINDNYGHGVGDNVLRAVTRLIRSNIRKTDAVYRYGGDEFVLVFPGTTSAQARHTASHLQKVLAVSRVEHVDPLPSVSFGIATYDRGRAYDKETLLEAADAALYDAKRKGKNRVCLYESLSAVGAA